MKVRRAAPSLEPEESLVIRKTVLVLSLLCLLGPVGAGAEPRRLADGTTADRWTLPNGLEVVTRDMPGAYSTSVSWGYHYGLDHDPANRPGFATLLAEVAYTATAGEVPARTRDEMESLRPQGWSLRVNHRQTVFTESATPAQLPGVLHQVATRMAGVTVTDDVLARATATVRRTLGESAFGSPQQMLANQLRSYAGGADAGAIVETATGKALERVTAAEITTALARDYGAANGVIVIAGDLSSFDVRSVVASELGGLPAGQRLPEPPEEALDSVAVVLARPEVTRPQAALAVIAPALTDTIHPAFYLAMVALGSWSRARWGGGDRFQYSLLDDPRFVRFYPPMKANETEIANVRKMFEGTVNEDLEAVPAPDLLANYRRAALWLMGGPLPRELADRMKTDAPALNVLSVSLAMQALWGSDEFWTQYRERTDLRRAKSLGSFASGILDPKRQAVMLLVPRR
jgi:hypothetical protein